jgi:two-component system, chemotaxis family, CheB/CheR fusion protein
METAYEELQSTVEELETTNEELQSTNEELETTNEELQSTNEELKTMNDELNDRSLDLNEVNAFLNAVLGSIQSGVVVVDKDLVITAWNEGAHELWGLRGDEVVGQHFLNLDIGLPVADLRPPLRETLGGVDGRELRIPARNRRGRDVDMHISLMPLVGPDEQARGVIMLMRPDGADGADGA